MKKWNSNSTIIFLVKLDKTVKTARMMQDQDVKFMLLGFFTFMVLFIIFFLEAQTVNTAFSSMSSVTKFLW